MHKCIIVVVMSALVMMSSPNSLRANDYSAARKALQSLFPAESSFDIRQSAVPNILEVRAGIQVLYVTIDGEHIFAGPLIAVDGPVSLTEQRLTEYRYQLLDEVNTLDTIGYPSTDEQYLVTVITDIDCPYCRQLHQDLAQYQSAGISLRYLMLPRAGRDSDSYRKTQYAMCAAQPDEAITAAMNGTTPPPVQCDSQLDRHIEMARRLGAQSTPNIVLPDGTLIAGYQTADQLLALLRR